VEDHACGGVGGGRGGRVLHRDHRPGAATEVAAGAAELEVVGEERQRPVHDRTRRPHLERGRTRTRLRLEDRRRGGSDGGDDQTRGGRVGLLHLERCFRHFTDVHADTGPTGALDDEVVPPVVAGKDQVAGGGSLGGQDDQPLCGGAAHAVALQVHGEGRRGRVTGGARAGVFVR